MKVIFLGVTGSTNADLARECGTYTLTYGKTYEVSKPLGSLLLKSGMWQQSRTRKVKAHE